MENISELKQRLRAVTQTRQICNATYLLATSRMKRSLQNIGHNLSYMQKLRSSMRDIIVKTRNNEVTDPFLELNAGGKALFFVITSDKGMCGAYNTAVIHTALEKMEQYPGKTVLYSLGVKGTEQFLARGITPDDNWYGASQKPSLFLAKEIGEQIVDLYDDTTVSEVYVVYTEYCNSVSQKPVCRRILPLLEPDFTDLELTENNDVPVLYEPDPETVYNEMVPQYVTGMIYDILMQAAAGENAARMNAMQSATRNADEMIAKLTEQINAVRQLLITNEITEISAALALDGAV